jgi:hypothetical protein
MVGRTVRWPALVVVGSTACTPTFSDDTSSVSTPRLLAVQATPAEAPPGMPFSMTALYVDTSGTADPSPLTWALCLAQSSLGNPDPIAPACFGDTSAALVALGGGGTVSAAVPSDACQLFGPDSPPPQPGEPARRPTDPDATGGFYLPVRVGAGDGAWSAAFERITCQPSGVTQSVFTALSQGYVPNENPAVASLVASIDPPGASRSTVPPDSPGAGPGLVVAAGSHVALRVGWSDCRSVPAACGGAETYLLVDPTTKSLATARESIVASWYASSGTFDLDRAGRDGTDSATTVDNGWTAPAAAGTARLWIVLRDARGGVGWASYVVAIQ